MGAADRNKAAYLGALASSLDVARACEKADTNIRTVYRWRKDPEFRASEERILGQGVVAPPVVDGDPLKAFLTHYRATEKLVESCDLAGIELEDLDEAKKDQEFAAAFARVDRRRRQRALDAIYGKARTGDAASAKAFLDRVGSKGQDDPQESDGGLLEEEREGLGSFSEENGGVQ